MQNFPDNWVMWWEDGSSRGRKGPWQLRFQTLGTGCHQKIQTIEKELMGDTAEYLSMSSAFHAPFLPIFTSFIRICIIPTLFLRKLGLQ